MALAFVVAGGSSRRRLKELGKPVDWAYEMVFAALDRRDRRRAAVVGGRELVDAKDDLLGSLFSGTGLVWYGGAIGGAIGVLLWAWRRDVARPAACSTRAPCRSPPATRSAGSAASSPATATTARPGTARGRWRIRTAPCRRPSEVHPTPVYETITMLLVALRAVALARPLAAGHAVRAVPDRSPALERFLVEFVRRNDARARSASPSRSCCLGA